MVYIIGVTGASASGKSKFAICLKDHIVNELEKTVEILHMDNFYKGLSVFSDEELKLFRQNRLNFDSPNMIDLKTLENVLTECSSKTKIPIYERMIYDTVGFSEVNLTNVDVIIVEGIFIFNRPGIFKMCSLTIYVDTPPDIRLKRRLDRYETKLCNKQIEYYYNFVLPAFNIYTLPFRGKCNFIVNGTIEFTKNLELLGCFLDNDL